jgi:hypothetical protein
MLKLTGWWAGPGCELGSPESLLFPLTRLSSTPAHPPPIGRLYTDIACLPFRHPTVADTITPCPRLQAQNRTSRIFFLIAATRYMTRLSTNVTTYEYEHYEFDPQHGTRASSVREATAVACEPEWPAAMVLGHWLQRIRVRCPPQISAEHDRSRGTPNGKALARRSGPPRKSHDARQDRGCQRNPRPRSSPGSRGRPNTQRVPRRPSCSTRPLR